MPRLSRKRWLQIGGGVALVVLLLVALNHFVHVGEADLERLIDRAGWWGPVVYAVILFAGLSVPFNPVSDLLTVAVAAILFDPWVAIGATFASQTVSLMVNYTVGRTVGRGVFERATHDRDVPFLDRLQRHLTVRAVFLVRFALPLTAVGIDFVSYLCGIRRMPPGRFYTASIVPWTILSIVYFESAGRLREISPVLVLLPAAVMVAATSAILVVVRRRLTEADEESDRVAAATSTSSSRRSAAAVAVDDREEH